MSIDSPYLSGSPQVAGPVGTGLREAERRHHRALPPPIVYLARPCSGLWRLPLRGLSRTARAGLISYEAEIVYILRLGYGITSGKIIETEIDQFNLKTCCYNIL